MIVSKKRRVDADHAAVARNGHEIRFETTVLGGTLDGRELGTHLV
jgi:hypothetical protein